MDPFGLRRAFSLRDIHSTATAALLPAKFAVAFRSLAMQRASGNVSEVFGGGDKPLFAPESWHRGKRLSLREESLLTRQVAR